MKKFLLSWYGMTDLRAALGLDESDGPILAALATQEYSHALILGYTNPLKAGSDPQAIRGAYKDLARRSAIDPSVKQPGRSDQLRVVDSFANTPAGHDLFHHWLLEQLRKRCLNVTVSLIPTELVALNDSKGIHEAENKALDFVLAEEGEKEITLYLSPGTPVMAFNWAFVALMNPSLNLRVIAASDPRHPPESISLPYELLDPSARKRRQSPSGDSKAFDTIYHLFGEQRIPSLLVILQFPALRHIFVSSNRYPAACMRPFLPAGAVFEEIHVDPFDPMGTHTAILRSAANLRKGERVGFNVTGGTKLMYAGAESACRKIGGIPFYLESQTHSLMFLDDFSSLEIDGLNGIEMFFELSGMSVSNRGLWSDEPLREKRRKVTQWLWDNRKLIRGVYRSLGDVLEKDKRNGKPQPFHVQNLVRNANGQQKLVRASLDESLSGEIQIGDIVHGIENCRDFAQYLCGGWLEEYTYALLEPYLARGALRDIRIGVELSWNDHTDNGTDLTAQELDIVFTDGRRLYIVECKAGNVATEHIYKLENLVRGFGGVEARGMIVSAIGLWPHLKTRVENSRNIDFVAGPDVPRFLIDRLIGSRKSPFVKAAQGQ